MANIREYLWWMGASALACAALYFALNRRQARIAYKTALTLVLCAALGVVCAKVLYCLVRIDFVAKRGLWAALTGGEHYEFSYFGGVLGACLGAMAAGRCAGMRAGEALDAFAAPGLVMAALARFGEYFLDTLGTGMYLSNESLSFFPLAVKNEWGEAYLAVFVFEGLACALAAALAKCPKHRFARALFYLCLPQVFFESLRNESISWLFVRVEQLICMLTVEGVLTAYALWGKGMKRRFAPPVIGLLCAALFVGVEFALDKTTWPDAALYAVMIAGVVALAATEITCARRQAGIARAEAAS